MRVALLTLSFLLVPFTVAAQGPEAARSPNMILLVADDMGYSDIGAFGSEIRTPNVDALARGGVRFTQFYNNARCSPTRAALLTGVHPQQAGPGEVVTKPQPDAYLPYITRRAVTIAEVLRDAGYATMASGKWHLGLDRPHWPVDRGFQRFFGHIDSNSNYFGRNYHSADPSTTAVWLNEDEPFMPPAEGFYSTDVFTDAALEFIDQQTRSDRPFFIYMAYTAPHWPVHALEQDIAKYDGAYTQGWEAVRQARWRKQLELGVADPRWELSSGDYEVPEWDTLSPEKRAFWERKMQAYAGNVDRLDQNIGRIMEKLRETGEERNTLVLFFSDNGATTEDPNRSRPGAVPGTPESFMGQGGPWAWVNNTPFRRFKHWVHEGGIATPLIAYWPGLIEPRPGYYRHPTHVIDVMATALDAAGVRYPEVYDGNLILPLEGRSLMPVFRGDWSPVHDVLFWEHQGNRAVRQGKWKLVERFPRGWELYDMEEDGTEMHDLSDTHLSKKAELIKLYETWTRHADVAPWPFGPYQLED